MDGRSKICIKNTVTTENNDGEIIAMANALLATPKFSKMGIL